jgi:hypothetical protein
MYSFHKRRSLDEASARVQRRNGDLERKEERISKRETVLSNSALRNGALTRFLTTLTRTREPTPELV